eukprot:CAMPEP_0184857132 /NCGR_PEP_ID=MMETSP0580-20130426/2297_1 /TAXON_ID=1118495 /ORGANISM="Dactyliosolen fragilissimus" /LENGTH=64 /DNA_ID=CAMNT_0027352545 /DNA_START=96 /DNA_END=290 /DNA_ORIENTATION=+
MNYKSYPPVFLVEVSRHTGIDQMALSFINDASKKSVALNFPEVMEVIIKEKMKLPLGQQACVDA